MDESWLARQAQPARPDLGPGALPGFSAGGVRLMRALPLPAPGAAADQRASVAALDFAPESFEAEAETVVGAGRLRHSVLIFRRTPLLESERSRASREVDLGMCREELGDLIRAEATAW